jgi:hypothetical protein
MCSQRQPDLGFSKGGAKNCEHQTQPANRKPSHPDLPRFPVPTTKLEFGLADAAKESSFLVTFTYGIRDRPKFVADMLNN